VHRFGYLPGREASVWGMHMDLGLGDLLDEALREEIELIGDLVIAAAACPGRMGSAELDSILGVRH